MLFELHRANRNGSHISQTHLTHSHTKGQQSPLELWDLLKIFWGPKELASWQAELGWNPKDPTKAADTIKNLICMGPEIHKMWCGVNFALRPLVYNDQKMELALEWLWLPKEHHNFDGEVDIGKVSSPTEISDCPSCMLNKQWLEP